MHTPRCLSGKVGVQLVLKLIKHLPELRNKLARMPVDCIGSNIVKARHLGLCSGAKASEASAEPFPGLEQRNELVEFIRQLLLPKGTFTIVMHSP